MSKNESLQLAKMRFRNGLTHLQSFTVTRTTFYGGNQERKIVLRPDEYYRIVVSKDKDGYLVEASEKKNGERRTARWALGGNRSLVAKESVAKPPLNAEYLLHLFLKRDERDAVIGDLLERYAGKHERFGERHAKIWFYGEVMRSLWPLVRRVVARAGGLIVLGEWIRRHVS